MKIAGIAGKKHPMLKKGDAIELSPEDKVMSAAKDQVSSGAPEGIRWIPIQAKLLTEVQVVKGRETGRKSEPAQYIGKVEVTYRVLKLDVDRLTPTKKKVVKLTCKDCKDEIGAPDLQVVDCTLKDK